MPLRDHFHSPVNDKHRWDAVHGGWPMEIVRTLFDLLPPGYQAEPKINHSAPFEVDIATVRGEEFATDDGDGGGGTATLAVKSPTFTAETDLTELDEYEVLIFDESRSRTLVAAIELVSPANKNRRAAREQFNNKVAALLRQDVCVAIVDIVTLHRANLYVELLAHLGHTDPAVAAPHDTYAVTLRGRKPPPPRSHKTPKQPGRLDAWYFPLPLGQPLPTIPLWLSPTLRVELPLEPNYQEVCRLLRIP